MSCFSSSRAITILRNLSRKKYPKCFLRSLQMSNRMCKVLDSTREDFYRYTGGRWLWDEETQLRQRYNRFNVSELQRAAAMSINAQCVSITKLAEGGFNKVFRLVMEDGSVVIARLPNPNAGPSRLTTASEVATMDFVRTILDIPAPRVFAWSGNADNPVGSEYILMEEAPGIQLGTVWDGMDLEVKLKIVEEIVRIEKKLLSISFTTYGNIYFTNDAFGGCQPVEVTGDISQQKKQEIGERFVIGPVVNNDFWDQDRASLDIDRGPWKSHKDYLKAICDREVKWINRYAESKQPRDFFLQSEAQRSPDAHIRLYEKLSKVADHLLPCRDDLIRPSLWHWDLHTSNIFVDGGKVVCLIDWQDVWAGPLFLQARHPRFIDYKGEVMLKLPSNYESIADEEERSRIREQVEKSIILWAYESDTKNENPTLDEIFHLPHGRTRRETVEFSSNTWFGDIIPFRQCLIRIARNWCEINDQIACPISFTDEELEAHLRDGQGWNERADFWDSLDGFVSRDGWTSNENYEKALQMFTQLRDQGLQNLTGKERAEFEKQTRWAIQRPK